MKNKVLAILPHSIAGRLIVKSLANGFVQNGYEVDYYDELHLDNFVEFIKNKEYFCITGYDFSPLKLKVDNNLNITCVCYFADEIESKASGVLQDWQKYLPFLNEEGNYTFYWDRALTEQSKIKNIFYLPQFVDTEIYKPMGLQKEYDIIFAGRLDTDYRLNFTIELMQNFPQFKFAWFAIQKHFDDAVSRTDEKELLKKAYKGFIDNELDMAIAINKSKFAFTMNSQGISSLNHRTIQTAACKTLVISDYREELNNFKGNLPFYVDMGDLTEKINYYSNNPQAYNFVTEKCYDIVRQKFSAKFCVSVILNTIICK